MEAFEDVKYTQTRLPEKDEIPKITHIIRRATLLSHYSASVIAVLWHGRKNILCARRPEGRAHNESQRNDHTLPSNLHS